MDGDAEPELPLGWAARMDPGTGETYYVNEVTQTSQWERPTEEVALPRGWLVQRDATGKAYYVNPAQGTSQRDVPTDAAAGVAGMRSENVPIDTPFEDWAEGAGINAPKLAVTGKDTLRGVMLLEDVAVGEELCSVPRTTCLDLSAVEGAESPCVDLVPTALWTSLRWYERLATWLLAEFRRGEASPVSGYIGYLPRPSAFADAPLEWSDAELQELSYPPVVVSIREENADIRALHTTLQRDGGPLAAGVSLPELRWAVQLVLSRAFTSTILTSKELAKRAPLPTAPPSPMVTTARMFFGQLPIVGGLISEKPPAPVPAPGDGLDMAMMPMFDAFNHRSGARAAVTYDGGRNAFVLQATERLRKGTEAFISYGNKSNDELLQLFGFVEENNPHDVFLSIGLADFLRSSTTDFFASPSALENRFRLLASLKLEEALLGELTATGVPAPTLHALRVLLGTPAELDDPARLASPRSLATEERVWKAVQGYCKTARAAMGGSRKSDLAVAANARRMGQTRRAVALQFRSEKKRLLSELENRLGMQASRSRRAGRVIK